MQISQTLIISCFNVISNHIFSNQTSFNLLLSMILAVSTEVKMYKNSNSCKPVNDQFSASHWLQIAKNVIWKHLTWEKSQSIIKQMEKGLVWQRFHTSLNMCGGLSISVWITDQVLSRCCVSFVSETIWIFMKTWQ